MINTLAAFRIYGLPQNVPQNLKGPTTTFWNALIANTGNSISHAMPVSKYQTNTCIFYVNMILELEEARFDLYFMNLKL